MDWLRRLLGRPRPAPTQQPEPLSLGDALTASRAGLTEAQWRNLTWDQRNNYRWRATPH